MLEDVLGEEAARPELRDAQVEHTHACHEAASVAVPIVGPIAAELVNLGVHDGGNHLHAKQHEQRLDVHHPVRQLQHRNGRGIASDSITIAVTALSQNPYYESVLRYSGFKKRGSFPLFDGRPSADLHQHIRRDRNHKSH